MEAKNQLFFHFLKKNQKKERKKESKFLMKRQRNNNEETNEQEAKRSRVASVISEMNRVAQERERNRQEEFKHWSSSSSSSSDLLSPTFLRSLPAPVQRVEEDKGWREWRERQQREEEEEKHKEEEELKQLQLLNMPGMSAINNLFAGSRPILYGLANKRMTKEEEKYYPSGEDLFNLRELTNLIHEYSNPKYLVPHEKCQTLTSLPSSTIESKEEKAIPPCLLQVVQLAEYMESREYLENEYARFEDFDCALYCLLTNLPTHINLLEEDEDDDGVQDEISIPFSLNVGIRLKNPNTQLWVKIEYDEKSNGYVTRVSMRSENGNLTNATITLEEAIDLILYYGPRANILINLDINEEDYSFDSFENDLYWNTVSIVANIDEINNGGHLFSIRGDLY
jgi:hypothetical protein